MIKKLGLIMLLSVFISGCGAKKRTSHSKRNKKTVQQSRSHSGSNSIGDSEQGSFPFPEDMGRFVKFPITSIDEYISTFSEIAQFEMKAYGIPASITLAQGILESGYGRSNLTLKTNNHFGIKCHTGWDGEYDFHDDDAKGECFRKYNHPMYSFRDHSIFLSTRARYAFLFDLKKDDYIRWAKGLRQAGYATDKRYPQKLISFIEQYQLYKYDKEILGKGFVFEKEPKTYDYKTHVVQKGDTLYSLSQRYFVSVPVLMKLNNMKNSTLSIGQELTVKSIKINK